MIWTSGLEARVGNQDMSGSGHRRGSRASIKDAGLVAERRKLIAEAAIRTFARKGFAAATTRDIGLQAKLSQGTLYNYVRSKTDILFLVCDSALSDYHDAVAAAIAGITDPRQRLLRAIRAVVRAQYDHRTSIALVLREAHLLDAASRRKLERRIDVFLDEITAIVAAGTDRRKHRASARLLAETVTYLPTIFAMRAWRLREEGPPDKVIDDVVEIIAGSLKLD